ncbi:hypothetical protein CEXT_406701 [Caerostris extrusa]|uniref:Uncharacterized protein n=1 Tax=Caerostris extrusa TaxID=172846 RepID=A0AAV4XVB6_CAEEX|nr:hypothetical protein CEXT_406701 [Caerostris extrusa]
MKSLEQQWKELGDFVAEQNRRNKEKMEQLSAYESLRAKVLEWLTSMEFKTLAKEHLDYGTTIDKVNDLGNSYDALLRGEKIQGTILVVLPESHPVLQECHRQNIADLQIMDLPRAEVFKVPSQASPVVLVVQEARQII